MVPSVCNYCKNPELMAKVSIEFALVSMFRGMLTVKSSISRFYWLKVWLNLLLQIRWKGSQKGGVGKSTMCDWICFCKFVERGWRQIDMALAEWKTGKNWNDWRGIRQTDTPSVVCLLPFTIGRPFTRSHSRPDREVGGMPGRAINSRTSTLLSAWVPPLRIFIIGTGRTLVFAPPR